MIPNSFIFFGIMKAKDFDSTRVSHIFYQNLLLVNQYEAHHLHPNHDQETK